MRRVLVISPHFPPDATAGAHRVRVIAPYLEAHGWRPTVLTVDPRDYEGMLDQELGDRVPATLDVARCRAWSARRTRRFGLGDLGLRALPALWRESRARAMAGGLDAVFVTTYPVYPAMIGARLRRRYGIPFVLDLQDPWVGAWGETVGAGPGGRVDIKSRISRAIAVRLERRVVPAADALTGVSTALLEELAARFPAVANRPREVLPIGIDPADVAQADDGAPAFAPPDDGGFHVCYVGTALPLGQEVMRVVLDAAARAAVEPALASRLRLHFVGTSNEARPDAAPRVRPLAEAAGVGALVSEHPPRVPFYDALRVLRRAGAILLAGTSEARYTASKLHAALAARRPILALVHADSDVAKALAPIAAREPSVALFTYGPGTPVSSLVPAVAGQLARWTSGPPPPPAAEALADEAQGPALAARLARLLDQVSPAHA